MKSSTEERIAFICMIIQTVAAIVGIFITHQIWLFISILVVLALFTDNYLLARKYKKLYNTVLDSHLPSLNKYLSESAKRKQFNQLHLDNIVIKYIITDNEENSDYLDFEIIYTFKGKTLKKTANKLLLMFSLSQINKREDVTLTTRCLSPNDPPRVIDPLQDQNLLHYTIPLYTTKRNEGIDVEVALTWRKYCLKSTPDKTLIDPRNYAKSADQLNICIENHSKDFIISPITLSEYNRETHLYSNKIQLCATNTTQQKYEHSINIANLSPKTVFALIFHNYKYHNR